MKPAYPNFISHMPVVICFLERVEVAIKKKLRVESYTKSSTMFSEPITNLVHMLWMNLTLDVNKITFIITLFD